MKRAIIREIKLSQKMLYDRSEKLKRKDVLEIKRAIKKDLSTLKNLEIIDGVLKEARIN